MARIGNVRKISGLCPSSKRVALPVVNTRGTGGRMAAMPSVARWVGPVFTTLVVLALACAEPRSTEPDVSGTGFAKAPAGPSVSSAVPDNAPQDTTLDVRVLGSGYDQGSRVDLALAGTLDSVNVHTNSTRFVASTELVANVTISRNATLAKYDVVVSTSKGKKGIGTELFLIRAVNDIGTLGGGSGAIARGVNAAGMIVGSSADPSGYVQAFVWTETDGMRALPRVPTSNSASAYAINSAQIVVGNSGTVGPVRWVPTGPGTWAVQALGYMGGTNRGTAFAVNEGGVIAGYSDDAASIARPVVWTDTGMIALPVPPGAADGQARDINGQGTAVGFYHPSGTEQRAIAWPASGGAVDLPACSGGTMTTAYAINDAGVVVGSCTIPGKRGSGGTFAVRWLPDPTRPNAWLAPEIITNPVCSLGDLANSINNAGEIVGDGCAGPFYWDSAHGFKALATLPQLANGQGALGINDPSTTGTFRIVGVLGSSSGLGHAVWWRHP